MNIKNSDMTKDKGFTLIELLMAAALGVMTTLMAGQVIVRQIDSSKRIQRRDRIQSDWVNANRFITTEINRSQYAVDEISSQEAENCGIDPKQARLALYFAKEQHLKPAIYYISKDDPAWEGILLKRCGPSLNKAGDYKRDLENGIIIHGLKNVERGYTQTITNKKLVEFKITLKGLDKKTYDVQGSARSRIQSVITRPGEQRVCIQDPRNNRNGIKINLTSGSDRFTPDQNRMEWIQKTNGDVLICGFGGGDTIHGGDGDDQIEAGGAEASAIFGGDGNDRILGGAGNDTLQGGEGDDTLIGGSGDDLLEGGLGTNYYLPGIDQTNSFCEHDRIVGTRDGFDIIFFKNNMDQYLQSNNCNNSSCRISKIQENNRKLVDIIKGDILVFNDQKVELLSGEAENLEPPAPGPCTLTVKNQPPPEPPEDPRWAILREANPYVLDYARKVVDRFDRANSAFPVSDLATIAIDVINEMPQEIKNKYCGHWKAGNNQRMRKYVFVLYLVPKVGRCEPMRYRYGRTGSTYGGWTSTQYFIPHDLNRNPYMMWNSSALTKDPRHGINHCNLSYLSYRTGKIREAGGCN